MMGGMGGMNALKQCWSVHKYTLMGSLPGGRHMWHVRTCACEMLRTMLD